MPRYRFIADAPGFVPDLHRVLQPGEEFESELVFSPAHVELLDNELQAADSEPEPEEVA